LVTQRALAAYPDRPIHLIVPFAAGGNADIVSRITGDLISKALGQPVVVENRGGGGALMPDLISGYVAPKLSNWFRRRTCAGVGHSHQAVVAR
jgi:hypothetical protein